MAVVAKKTIGYFSRNGLSISQEQYQSFAADPSYVRVKSFDNGVVRVLLRWIGLVRKLDNYFPGEMPIFEMAVWNYNSSGVMVEDPLSGKTYSNEEDAIKAYEAFLESWTESGRDENGVFVEEENEFTPPPPPNLDAPDSDVKKLVGIEDDGVGAW